MKRWAWALALGLVLPGCKQSADTTTAPAEEAAQTSAAPVQPPAPAAAATEVSVDSLPKLGKLDEVEYDTLKKQLADAGWRVSGSATKSAMYAINVTLTRGDVVIRLRYYRDGGDSWKKRLEEDGAAIHEAGNVLVGVNIEKGSADPKKVLAALVG